MNLLRRIVCAIVGHKWPRTWDQEWLDIWAYYRPHEQHLIDSYFQTCRRCQRIDRDRPTKPSPASPLILVDGVDYSTAEIVSRFLDGWRIDDMASDYKCDRLQIEAAIAFELKARGT